MYRQDLVEILQPKFKKLFIGVTLIFLLDLFEISILPTRTVHALVAALLIYYCLFKNNNRVANYVFNNTWLIRIGKVSYGVYLYHLFVPELCTWIIKIFASWNIDLFYNSAMPDAIKPYWLFIQYFSFLMVICAVSWKLIEKPINNLKKNFENRTSVSKIF